MINGAAMNLQFGKMYLVKEYRWSLFPRKELARTHWGRGGARYNCSIGIVELNTCFVCLEQDENVFKILDCNGNIGWIGGCDFSKYFELVKELC